MTPTTIISMLLAGNGDDALAAAEALEVLSRHDLDTLLPYRLDLLIITARTSLPAVQWHLAEVVPRLSWSKDEVRVIIDQFANWIHSSTSVIVRSSALAGICGLSLDHLDFMPIAKRYLARALKFGTPAEQASARRLIGRTDAHEV